MVGLFLPVRLVRARRRDAPRPLVVRLGHRRTDVVDDRRRQGAAGARRRSASQRSSSAVRSLLAVRFRPVDRSELGALARRYRDRMGPAHRWLLIAHRRRSSPSRIAAAAIGQWQSWLLFRHGPDLDQRVPELGGDLGYYLFDLPFLTAVSTWIRQLLLVALALTAFGYAVSGGLRLPIGGPALGPAGARPPRPARRRVRRRPGARLRLRPPPGARHRAPEGSFVGAGYTELNVGVPATWVLGVVALVTGFLLVDGARRGRWRPPLIALGAWAVLQLLLGVAAPALVQRYVVAPAEAARELPYLDPQPRGDPRRLPPRHRRPGRGRRWPTGSAATPPPPPPSPATSPASRCSTPTSSPTRCRCSQGTTATRITDVDLDRYEIDGETPPGVRRRPQLQPQRPARAGLGAAPPRVHPRRRRRDRARRRPRPRRPPRRRRPGHDARPRAAPSCTSARTSPAGTPSSGPSGPSRAARRSTPTPGSRCPRCGAGPCSPLSAGEIEPLLLRRADGGLAAALPPRRDRAAAGAGPVPHVRRRPVPGRHRRRGGVGRRRLHHVAHVPVLRSTSDSAGRGSSDRVNYVHASVKATVDAYDGTVHLYRTEGAAPTTRCSTPGTDLPRARRADQRAARRGPRPPALPGRPDQGADRAARPVPRRRRRDAVQRHGPVVAVGGGQHRRRAGPAPARLRRSRCSCRAAIPVVGGHWVATVPFSPGTGARRELGPRRAGRAWRSPTTTTPS